VIYWDDATLVEDNSPPPRRTQCNRAMLPPFSPAVEANPAEKQ
jgi:hypothetical protein